MRRLLLILLFAFIVRPIWATCYPISFLPPSDIEGGPDTEANYNVCMHESSSVASGLRFELVNTSCDVLNIRLMDDKRYGLAGVNVYLDYPAVYPNNIMLFAGYSVNSYLSSAGCVTIVSDSTPAGRVLISTICNSPIGYDTQPPEPPWVTHELLTLTFNRTGNGTGQMLMTQAVDTVSPEIKAYFTTDPPFSEWCPYFCGFPSYCSNPTGDCWTCAMRKYYVSLPPPTGGGPGGGGCPPRCQS